jgi:hypothetical protein
MFVDSYLQDLLQATPEELESLTQASESFGGLWSPRALRKRMLPERRARDELMAWFRASDVPVIPHDSPRLDTPLCSVIVALSNLTRDLADDAEQKALELASRYDIACHISSKAGSLVFSFGKTPKIAASLLG